MYRTTEETCLKLLIRADDRGIDHSITAEGSVSAVATGARNRAGYQSAVIAPIEAQPGASLPRLILQVSGLVKLLIVVNAENPGRSRGSGSRAADLRREESGRDTGEHNQSGEPMEIRNAHAPGESRDLRALPLDGKRNRRCTENAEVVSIVRVLPDVLTGNDEVFPKRLLNASVEFIAPARTERGNTWRRTKQERIQYWIAASLIGKH